MKQFPDTTVGSTTPREATGKWLTTWSVSEDGSRARLGFADDAGRPSDIDLPVEVVSGLLMTLPSVLQAALDRRGDSSARVVQPVETWRLERAAGGTLLILTLATPDGFSVAFTLPPEELAAMAEVALRPGTCVPARVVN